MANKKVQIHEWDIEPYPRKLWVVKTRDLNVIKEHFLDEKGNDLVFAEDDADFKYDAQVIRVRERSTRNLGSLVHIAFKLSVSAAAHEAFHVADDVGTDCGLQIVDGLPNEHIAYLLGWVTDKIWQVNTNRIK